MMDRLECSNMSNQTAEEAQIAHVSVALTVSHIIITSCSMHLARNFCASDIVPTYSTSKFSSSPSRPGHAEIRSVRDRRSRIVRSMSSMSHPRFLSRSRLDRAESASCGEI